jgi:hypothetical protein
MSKITEDLIKLYRGEAPSRFYLDFEDLRGQKIKILLNTWLKVVQKQ